MQSFEDTPCSWSTLYIKQKGFSAKVIFLPCCCSVVHQKGKKGARVINDTELLSAHNMFDGTQEISAPLGGFKVDTKVRATNPLWWWLTPPRCSNIHFRQIFFFLFWVRHTEFHNLTDETFLRPFPFKKNKINKTVDDNR